VEDVAALAGESRREHGIGLLGDTDPSQTGEQPGLGCVLQNLGREVYSAAPQKIKGTASTAAMPTITRLRTRGLMSEENVSAPSD